MKNLLSYGVALAAGMVWAEPIVLQGTDTTLKFSEDGKLLSLVEKAGGRELVAKPDAWAYCIREKAPWSMPKKLELRGKDELVFTFSDGARLVEKVEPVDFGWTFRIVESTAKDFQHLIPCSVKPVCRTYRGNMANALSDEESAVVIRAFDYEGQMASTENGQVYGYLEERFPAAGKVFALVAGPKKGIVEKLRRAVKASGLACSEAGGPWSLGSEQTRQSYMFANCMSRHIDGWIDAAKRAGVSIFHFHCWWSSLGHYGVNTAKYPGGMKDLKAAVDKVKAAGMNVSLHSLTACIDFFDPWIFPVCHSNLIATYTYTLAQPVTDGSQEVVVNEMPGPKHDLVTTYTSNGNILEIDGELIEYTGIRREKPYAFTGIKRGSQRTKKRDHAAGARTKYLQQRYFSFYPEVDSPLADELADRLAGVYNEVGADMIYFDGSEGMKDAYATSKMAAKIAGRLDRGRHPPRIEMSCFRPHFWPFRSTIGAWDNVRYGAKPFEVSHLRSNESTGRKSNFLETQMGWWQPQMPNRSSRCRFPDETEYFSAKNAGADTAMSLQGLMIGDKPLAAHQEKALTLIGWYERFRLARAFTDAVQAELRDVDREGRLEQDADGAWIYTPVETAVQRIRGEGLGGRWAVNAKAGGEADLRVEAFYNLGDYQSPAAKKLFEPATFAAAKKRAATPKVKIAAAAAEDPERGAVTRITATNDKGGRRGVWAYFERTFERPDYFNLDGSAGVGFWVRGDGSGAVLDVQLQNPREYSSACRSDHLLKLDFKGWRYVEFLYRERDVDEFLKYEWPWGVSHPEYMNMLTPKFVQAVRFILNEIPETAAEGVLDGNSEDASARLPSVDIAVSDVKALTLKETVTEDVSVKVNGKRIEVPFEFASGDWAELQAGVWTLYDERGDFKERAEGPRLQLKKGENRCVWSAKASDRCAARAEVSFFVRGRKQPALKPLTDGMKRELDWEAEMPAVWAPSKGAAALPAVKVRPGEKAKLEVVLRGPVKDPVLKVGDFVWKLESVEADKVKKFTEGPVVEGVRALALESSDPDAANALVEIVKHY